MNNHTEKEKKKKLVQVIYEQALDDCLSELGS